MFGREKVSTTITLAAVTILAAILTMVVGLGVAAAADPAEVKTKVSTEGNLTVVDVSIANNTNSLVKFDIIATMPETGKLAYVWPPTYQYDGKTLTWVNARGVNAGKTTVGYQFKIEGAAGKLQVRANYYGNAVGAVQTEWISVGAAATSGMPVGATRAAARAPAGVLDILPVPAAAADANAFKAVVAATGNTVAMGTTGLENVSVGAPVVFKAGSSVADGPAKTFAWTLSGPTASKAALDKKDAEVVRFTPDVPGVYKVDVVVGNEKGSAPMQSVQIRAGAYIGVDKGNCKVCHSQETSEWARTPHASIMKAQIDGGDAPATSGYNEGCLRCHTTGYYIGAANDGFADVQARIDWKFPAAASIRTGKGNWEAVPAELKNLANIQCESCHGPAAAHVTSKAPMAASRDEGVCNICHDGGGSHTRGTELRYSKHDDAESQAWTYPTGPTRQACVRCHSGNGYVSFLASPTEQAAWDNGKQTVSCAVCHDPHSQANPMQLRVVGKPIEVAGITKDFGLSATCVECHNARNVGADAVKGATPHYSTAAEMLADTGGVTYGQALVNSPHGMLVGVAPVTNPANTSAKLFGGENPGPCVTCHMWPTPAGDDPNRFKVGQHSFNVTAPDGTEYTASCKSCHGDIAGFNMGARGDYDGNGKVEGVQTEVAGLLNVLLKDIEASGIPAQQGHPYFNAAAKAKATDKQNNAIYNYLFVRGHEGADGKAAAIHNFKRSVALLQASYRDLTGEDVPGATLMK